MQIPVFVRLAAVVFVLLILAPASRAADPVWLQYDKAGTAAFQKNDKALAERYWWGATTQASKELSSAAVNPKDRMFQMQLMSLIGHQAQMCGWILDVMGKDIATKGTEGVPAELFDKAISKGETEGAQQKQFADFLERKLGRNDATAMAARRVTQSYTHMVETLKKQKEAQGQSH